MDILSFNNIDKQFNQHVILHNFSLNVKRNDIVALTGQSGCGKSTLLNIIGLLDKPDNGEILIKDNKNPKPNSKKATLLQRNTIGYLFQNYALVDNMSVDKNLDIALEYVKKSKIEKRELKVDALNKVGLKDKLKSKVYELSGGEQQRVAIARLILKPCEIILADEPTGSLDVYNRDKVIELLKELNKEGKTIIIATHDKEVANISNNVVEL